MPQSRLTVLFPAITFALAGAFLSAILLAQHGRATHGDCGSAGCSEVLNSRWATFPPTAETSVEPTGVPLPLLGLIYFLGLGLWLIVVGRLSWAQRTWHLLPMGVAAVGGLASVALLSGMAFLGAWCPLCLAVHVMNLALVPYIYFSRPERGPNDADVPAADPRPVLMGAALALSVGAAVWFGWQSIDYRQRSHALSAALARATVDAASASSVSAPVAQTFAPPDAVATASVWALDSKSPDADTVVVFTDLQCPHCRAFEQRLFDVIAPKFHENLRVAIKHYPLCAQCNFGVTDLHPWACEAAYLAEAGRLQGGAAAFLKVLRAIPPRRSQPWSESDAVKLAQETGLNPQQFVADWQSEAVRNRVAQDIAEARQLGVRETPTVFVNGRKLDSNVRDLPEYWEGLASRTRQTAMPSTSVAASTASAKPYAAAKPAAATEAAPSDVVPLTITGPQAPAAGDKHARVAATLLSMHDANKDGVLQPNEWTKIYTDGRKIDTNHDNVITVDEIRAGIVDVQGGHDEPAATGAANSPTGRTATKPAAETPRISTVYEGDELQIAGPTLQGGQFDIREHRGKPVLVVFWTSWCTHCLDEASEVLRIYRKYHDAGLEVVGVNGDIATTSAAEFVERNALPWPQIHFADGPDRGQFNPLARRYNVRGYPALFLVDREGRVSGVHLRGNDIDAAVAKALDREPTPLEEAQRDREEIAASLFRPANVSKEGKFEVKLGDHLRIAGPTVDGGRFELAQHAGKPVLVAFWASWCPHCKKELPTIKEVYERYKDRGLEVVGISADRKRADLDAYLAANPLPWPTIYFDADGLRGFNCPEIYWHGVHGIPALFLVGPDGTVAAVKPRGDAIDREVAKVLGVEPAAPSVAANPVTQFLANLPAALRTADPPASQPVPVANPAPAPNARKSEKPKFDSTPAPVLADGIIKRYDLNRDGILQKLEYAAIPGDFSKYDTNRDGQLSAEELSIAIAVAQRLKQVLPNLPPAKTTP